MRKSIIYITAFFFLFSCAAEKEKKGSHVYDGILDLSNNIVSYFSYCKELVELVRTGRDTLANDHLESYYKMELPQLYTIYDNFMVCRNILKDVDSTLSEKIARTYPRIRDRIFKFSWMCNDSLNPLCLDSLILNLARGEKLAQEVNEAFMRIKTVEIQLKNDKEN
jgi:hypothetical protein